MKNFKRILAAVCILAVLCAGVIMTVIAETGYTGDVAEAQALLDAVTAAEGTEAKRAAMDSLDAYIAGNTFDVEAEDYIAFAAAYAAAENALRVDEVTALVEIARVSGSDANWDAVLAQLQAKPVANADLPEEALADIDTYKFNRAYALLDEVGIETNGDTAHNRIKINLLNSFLKKNPLNEEHDDYAAFKEDYDAKMAEHNAAIEENLAALEDNAIISDYDLFGTAYWDMETPETSPVNSGKNDQEGGQVILNDGVGINEAGFATEGNGNNYFYINFKDGKTAYHSYVSPVLGAGPGVPNSSQGLIVELDFTYTGEIADGGFIVEGMDNSKTHFKEDGNPVRVPWQLLSIDKNGNIRCGRGTKDDPVLEAAATEGEWIHITAVYHPDTYMVDVYVDYALVGSASVKGEEYKDHQFKLGFLRFASSSVKGNFSFDNVYIYQGTTVRQLDRLQNMTDVELLEYYVDFASTDGKDITSRVLAYNRTAEIIKKYYSDPDGIFGNEDDVWMLEDLDGETAEQVKGRVAEYLALDMDAVVEEYKAQNLRTYVDKVTSVTNIARKPDNVSERTLAIEEIDSFLDSIGDYIDRDSDEFIKANAELTVVSKKIDADNNINAFVLYVGRFNNAEHMSLVAMQRHYTSATEVYNLFDNYAFEVVEDGFPSKDLYEAFAVALDDYYSATDRIAAKIRESNSQKIIDCVSFISSYRLPSDWEDNYDFIERYILIIRQTVREGNYVEDYEGLAEALAIYETINEYFYDQLQKSHIDEITARIDEYLGSDSYIARVGLIYYIENYIYSNDIDPENEELQSLILMFNTYKGELDIQEESYDKILRQNTAYFVNHIEELKTCVDYASMKEVYEKAKVYYYSMNVSSSDVQEAILTFDEYTVILEAAEEATAMFSGYAAQLEGAEDDELYAILAACCKYVDDIEVTISDEAAAAYSAFSAAYEEYKALVDAANGDLDEMFIAVGSASANSDVAPIISIILGMIA